jgi:glucosamine--fructose-6-phosphate aminotransferase (isomerizing)
MYSSLPSDVRSKHPYHMHDEIKAQPAAVGRSLSLAAQHGMEPARIISSARRVFCTGCGTSFHAATGGAWLLRAFSRGAVDARAVGALDIALYPVGLREGDVVIGVTHSAETTMTLRALRRAREVGASTVVVAGFPERLQLGEFDAVLPTGFPEERSWAHTASYLAAWASLAAVANMLSHPDERMDLSPLPEVVTEALQLEEMAHRMAASTLLVERYRDPARIVVVGGGPNAVTAREAVLKLLETSYVEAEAYDLEEMLHGPLAAVTAETLLMIIAPDGASVERAAELAKAAGEIGVVPLVLAGSDGAPLFEDTHRLVLPDVPEVLSPVSAVVPLQLFSYYLAVGKGTNPDLLRRDDERYGRARGQYK